MRPLLQRRGRREAPRAVRARRDAAHARRVGRHRAQRVRPLRQRRRRRQAPRAVAQHRGRAQQGLPVVHAHHAARLAGAVHRRGGVVRHPARRDVAGHAARVVGDAGDLDQVAAGVHRDREARRRRAGVARRVGHAHRQGVVAVVQRRRRRPAPLAGGGVRRHRGHHQAVVEDVHRGARLRRAAQRRGAVVGGVAVRQRAGHGARVVGYHQVTHRRRGRGVHRQRPRAALRAHLTHAVHHVRRERVLAVRHRLRRREAPAAAGVRRRAADQRAVVVDAHRDAAARRAVQRRGRVVGHRPLLQGPGRARVADHRVDARRRRRAGDHRHRVGRGRAGAVAGRIALHRREAVGARRQGVAAVHRQAPAAVRAHRGAAQHALRAVQRAVHGHRVARRAGAADDRRGVVAAAAAQDITGHLADVVRVAGDGQLRSVWWSSVGSEADSV